MTSERVQARVFGEVADEYHRFRPDYPAELVTDVLEYAALKRSGLAALEAGAGTGKATVAFAARGIRLTAVEPDPAMLAVLRAHAPQVDVVQSSFEEYPPPEQYGLLYSAQAWHWVDPQRRWSLAARALAPGGALALFWNGDSPADPELAAKVVALHQQHAPDIGYVMTRPTGDELVTDGPWQELCARPEFTDCERHFYDWRRSLSTVDFVAMLNTASPYRMLADDTRQALFDALLTELPPTLELHMGTVLYLARRRSLPY